MKTTKLSVIEKKMQKLVDEKKIRKGSKVYQWIVRMKNGEIFRPVYSKGSSWKYSSLFDKRNELKNVLNKLGIEYIEGNDAPKGGQTGALIKVTTKIKNC